MVSDHQMKYCQFPTKHPDLTHSKKTPRNKGCLNACILGIIPNIEYFPSINVRKLSIDVYTKKCKIRVFSLKTTIDSLQCQRTLDSKKIGVGVRSRTTMSKVLICQRIYLLFHERFLCLGCQVGESCVVIPAFHNYK